MYSGQQLQDASNAVPFNSLGTDEPRWYAIYTRARHESTVAAQLEAKEITSFLPLIAETHKWSDRRKVVQTPLFSCYVFVRLSSWLKHRLLILQTPGIVGVVASNGHALPIPEKEIGNIQTLLGSKAFCAPCPFLKLGRRVRIRGGSLAGVEGILVAKNADQSLVVSIELIQRSMAVRIDGYDIETV